MKKVDLKKELKHLYLPSAREVSEVHVPTMNYLMIDGVGDPNNSPAFGEAVEALFAVAYTIKFMTKKGELAIDYGVMPLEGLWWTDDMSRFSIDDKSHWKWTLMIMQPDFVSADMVAEAKTEASRKKGLPAIPRLYFDAFTENRCAQILHIGPFSEEGPSIEKVHNFITSRGDLTGKHHEIYLSDIRKAAPEKWKTVIRQPMQ